MHLIRLLPLVDLNRGSYKQWEEENIPPQVVFEVLSPSNSTAEMVKKHRFYEHYGVEEFIIIDPDKLSFEVWERQQDLLQVVEIKQAGWRSKKMGIHIKNDPESGAILVTYPDGRPFMDHVSLNEYAEEQRQITEKQKKIAEEQRQIADRERKQKEALSDENARLKAKLKELGLLDE